MASGRAAPAFPPPRPNEERLAPIRERLRAIGYTERALAERLGTHLAALAPDRLPVYRARLARCPDDLAAAAALLFFREPTPRAEAERALGAEALACLVDAGFFRRAARGALAAEASLAPCAGLFIATGERFAPPSRDSVMYLGGDSYALAYLAPEPPKGGRVLDLCTGSGVHAILAAARGAGRALGVDVSPRAIAFARFNAALNGVAARCEFRRGDLFGPVPEGERWDLILANPPFVPSLASGRRRVLFRDAGPRGEDVLRRIVEALPARLAHNGIAAIVSVFASERGRGFRRKIEDWLGPSAALDAVLFRLGAEEPEEYAASQAGGAAGAAYGRSLATLRRARIERLDGGVLALRRHPGATPPGFRTLDAGLPPEPDPRAILRALDGLAAARSVVFPEELLERPARRADDLVISDDLEAREGGLAPARHRARLRSGVGGQVGISRELRALLAAVDGARPLRAAIEAIAPELDIAPEALAARLFSDLVELVERGMLVPG
jgi:methylase of polypeptide subunit release factors